MITCDKCRYWDGYYCKNPSDYVNDKGESVCGMRDDAIPVPGEKLGISPERLEELLRAEQEGRLIVLPCKVGDTVHDIIEEELLAYRVHEYNLLSINNGNIRYWAECVTNEYEDDIIFWADEIGKTVFLTREEAEAALSKAGDSE